MEEIGFVSFTLMKLVETLRDLMGDYSNTIRRGRLELAHDIVNNERVIDDM